MAAGDTINGQIRLEKEKPSGSRLIPFGPVSANLVDQRNDVKNQLYVNPPKAFNSPPPGAGNRAMAPGLVFQPGEVIRVQHKSANLEEAADYDADEFELSVVELDLNTGERVPRTLTVADTEISANPTTSTSEFVDIYQATVPDRRRWYIAGSLNVAAVEVA